MRTLLIVPAASHPSWHACGSTPEISVTNDTSDRMAAAKLFSPRVVPCLPENAPFTPEQRAWVNGYLAGLFSNANYSAHEKAGAKPCLASLTILYGSQGGTAETLAKRIAAEAKGRNFDPCVLEANAFAKVDWTTTERLLLVTSTWGDGEPPDNAARFWTYLNSEAAPKLKHLSFSVLALGDKNYPDFCGAGKKFDARLERLGATRLCPRADCDVDYEAEANAWTRNIWPALEKIENRRTKMERNDALTPVGVTTDDHPLSSYSRSSPYLARLLDNCRLNAPPSAKDTRHLSIALGGPGLDYEVGDSLGVMPANCAALVAEILCALGCDGEEAVRDPAGQETSFRHALLHSFEITKPAPAFLQEVAARANDFELKGLLDPLRKADLDRFLYGREVIDFLVGFPSVKFTPVEFAGLLRKLNPRLYSIASSPKVHPGEVHLCVGTVRYQSHGRARKGVCSTFLADRVEADTPIPVFVQKSGGFRLPADASKPMIMIGAGTGIAPFRAFLEDRRAVGATGRNWLFFGDQHQAHDFLYREELEALVAGKALTRLDTAFSRDQQKKIYVQHRMLEHGRELWAWLEEGAHLYVCGDAKHMARGVDAALHEMVRTAGGKSVEQAADYVQEMKTGKRYQRDVY